MSKPETNLERRALLGDRQAQDECTRQGIALPCPLCGKRVKRSVSGMLFYCPECHYNTTFHSNVVNKEEALFIWNRRTAPPIGRCKDCAYKQKAAVNGKGFSICPASGMEITGDDFCSYFEEDKLNESKD